MTILVKIERCEYWENVTEITIWIIISLWNFVLLVFKMKFKIQMHYTIRETFSADSGCQRISNWIEDECFSRKRKITLECICKPSEPIAWQCLYSTNNYGHILLLLQLGWAINGICSCKLDAESLQRRPAAASPITNVTETLYYRPPAKITSYKCSMRYNALADTSTIWLSLYT